MPSIFKRNSFGFKRNSFELALLVLGTGIAWSQVDRTEINGVVTDPSGSTVTGARVVVTEDRTALRREVFTPGSGTFDISSLPAGSYTVTISAQGFREVRFENVRQTAGQVRTLNAQLQITGALESVEVQASTPEVDRTTATIGGSVEQVQVQQMPINGRNWSTLTQLVPGAIDTGGGTQKTIRFNGQGNDDGNFRLDGNDFSGIQNQAPKSALRLQISMEAIQEFTVDTAAYTVENGETAGGQVNVVSKSGSNSYHGSLFEFLRNNDFDARSPFNASPNPQPPFHLNQFGASLGGDIIKNKTFFFVTYEGFRQSLGLTQVGFVPSPAFRQQVATAQPGLASLMNAFPQGTGPSGSSDPTIAANVQQYIGTTSSPVREDSGLVRVDHRFNDQNSAYARYNIDDGTTATPLGQLNAVNNVTPRLQNGILEYLHLFSPAMVNEMRFGFNRNLFYQYQVTGLPLNFVVPNLSELYENYNKLQASTSFDFRDDLTRTLGAHTLKAGIEIKRIHVNEGNAADGTASWASLTDFLNNQLNSLSDMATEPVKGLRKTDYFGYIMDSWKVSPSFTATIGVRYNFIGPFYEVNNRAVNFDIYGCGGYCMPGGQFTNPNYNDFDPRVSIAWAPRSFHDRTILRMGYGVYRGDTQLGDQDSSSVNDIPSITLQSSSTNTYSYPVNPALIPTTGLAVTPRSLALHHPDSYAQTWTVSVQQLLPANVVATIAYVGTKGTDLFQRSYVNVINPLNGVRPLAPQFPAQIDVKNQQSDSSFHALQLNVRRNLASGLFLAGNYMWSHAIDDASAGAGDADYPQNVACFRCERSNSDFNAGQTGTISLVYQLPFGRGHRYFAQNRTADLFIGGWELSNLYGGRTGLPINVSVNVRSSAVPDGNSTSIRPNLVPGQSIYPANQNPGNWLNLAAFTPPVPGTFGDEPRNIAVGPVLWQDDVSLNKNFRIREDMVVNIRAEAFNVFNRAQYANPGSNISSASSFGVVTSLVNSQGLTGTGTPRQLQFAARFTF